jgi:hypothetical protein
MGDRDDEPVHQRKSRTAVVELLRYVIPVADRVMAFPHLPFPLSRSSRAPDVPPRRGVRPTRFHHGHPRSSGADDRC